MKRFLLLLAVFTLVISATFSQVLYEDDFESYAVGDYIAEQNTDWWTTWTGAIGTGEDALISDDYAHSGSNSVLVDEVDGATDLLLLLGNKTTGVYNVDFWMYIPSGSTAYYNFQHFEAPGVEWALQCDFTADGICTVDADGYAVTTFPFVVDTWIELNHFIDLDNDWAEFYYDGDLIVEWQWSQVVAGTPGENQLGSIDFFANTGNAYYFDDLYYETIPTAFYDDDFESYAVGDYIAEQNPDWWTTWTNAPGTGEDAIISHNQAHSGDKSVLVDEVDGPTDLIFKLGDKTAGIYDVSFWMYIETGFAGYYNFQHFELPGNEWAIEVYLNTDGTADVHAGGTNSAAFNYDHDTWIKFEHNINLTDDWAEFYVGGNLIHEWQWSLQADGTPGANQLGGIDFFAGAQGTDLPVYYFDDVIYSGSGGDIPVIAVDPVSFTEAVNAGQTGTSMLSIENTGGADLSYSLDVIYPDGNKTVTIPEKPLSGKEIILTNTKKATTNNGVVTPPIPAKDDVTLNYDGEDYASAIGNDAGGTWRVAAMFEPDEIGQYAGMELVSVDVYLADQPIGTPKIKVWNYGIKIPPGAGDLLYEQEFTPVLADWTNVELAVPVYISGGDLWVGYEYEFVGATYIAGADAGPLDPNGDWMSTGVGWGHLSENPDLPYNWHIRANLTGDPITTWLSVDPASGTVLPGESADIEVGFDATDLVIGNYSGAIIVNSNDLGNQQIELDVSLDVLVGINELEKISVMMYPNPVVNTLNIKADDNIISVEVCNLMGQQISLNKVNEMTHQINLSDLQTGVYIVKVRMETGFVTRKITVE